MCRDHWFDRRVRGGEMQRCRDAERERVSVPSCDALTPALALALTLTLALSVTLSHSFSVADN